jgi:hypothetical protein
VGMVVFLLDSGSPLLARARAIASSGRARLVVADPSWTSPFEDVQPGDRALVGTSVPSFFAHHLLHLCVRGRLGDVRLLLDSPVLDAPRIGYRWGPWLRGVLVPADLPVPPPPWPAPCSTYDSLADAIDTTDAPPVVFTTTPSPFPQRLQIQTTSRCSRGCTYCPKPRQGVPDRSMADDLFDGLLEECARHSPSSLELYLHAEPLEDPRLETLATRAKAACPRTQVSITTHERALGADRVRTLAASGLDLVFVSVNAPSQTTEVSLRRRLQRIAALAPPLRDAGKALVVVTLTNLLPEGLRGTFRKLCAAMDLPLEAYRATSRVGDARLRPHIRVLLSSEGCLRPFTTAHVLADGQVVSCCEDWRYRRVFGRVGDLPLADVWNGQEARQLRSELLDGCPAEPCDRCDILLDRRKSDT